MDNAPQVIWYLQTVFDRKVAFPGETLFASATVTNAWPTYIYIGNCYWSFTCYPEHSPGINSLKTSIPSGSFAIIPAWQLPVPDIQEGQYEAHVSLDTWIWEPQSNNWVNFGRIDPDRGESFYIIHHPRYRAFISRSNYDVDRPIVDAIVSLIQRWGFDTHTVGLNEIEEDERRVPGRIIEEIMKSDCVFAIATPRDISSIPAMFRTLTWLHNEVSFSFMAEKPTLLIADECVLLDGLTGTEEIPTIRYSAFDLAAFLARFNQLMPVIRRILTEQTYRKWEQARIQEVEEIRYQSFMAGMTLQRKLLLKR